VADETEIFRLDLDTKALEQKAARVDQIVSEITAKRAKKEDTSDLERQLSKELDGIAQLGQQEKKQAGTTEELVKQKEKLGAAMRLVGSQASALVGDLGGVIELLLTANKATIGVAAGLAAVGLAGAIFRTLKEDARKFTDELDRVGEHQRNLANEFLTLQERIAQTLEAAGVAGRAEAVATRARQFSAEQGIDEQLAQFGAVAEEIGKLTDLQTWNVMAGYLKTGRTAKFTGERAKDEAMIQDLLRQGAQPEAQAFLEARIEDTLKEVKARTAVPEQPVSAERYQRAWAKMIEEATRTEGLTPDDVKVLGRMRDWNLAPQVLANPQAMRTLFPENFGAWDWTMWAYMPGRDAYETVAGEKLKGGSRTIEEIRQMAEGFQQTARAEAAAPPPTPPVTLNVLNVGSQYNAPDTTTAPSPGRIGLSRMASSSYKTPLGGG